MQYDAGFSITIKVDYLDKENGYDNSDKKLYCHFNFSLQCIKRHVGKKIHLINTLTSLLQFMTDSQFLAVTSVWPLNVQVYNRIEGELSCETYNLLFIQSYTVYVQEQCGSLSLVLNFCTTRLSLYKNMGRTWVHVYVCDN